MEALIAGSKPEVGGSNPSNSPGKSDPEYCTNVQSRRTFVQSRAEKCAVPSAEKPPGCDDFGGVFAEALRKNAWKILKF